MTELQYLSITRLSPFWLLQHKSIKTYKNFLEQFKQEIFAFEKYFGRNITFLLICENIVTIIDFLVIL